MRDLRLEVVMLKAKTKKSYKIIAEEADISYDCFLKFTSGKRELSETNLNKLTAYLSTFENNLKENATNGF